MAKNLVQDESRYFNVAASYPAVPVSGSPIVYGAVPGVALTGEGEGGNAAGEVTMDTGGTYALTVTGAITAGAIVYFVTVDGTLTATVGTNIRFGYAMAAQAATGVIPVKVGY